MRCCASRPRSRKSSSHPLAVAVMDKVREERLPVPEAQDAKALPGRGVEGTVRGRKLALGSTRMLRELQLDEGHLLGGRARRLEGQGRPCPGWSARKGTSGACWDCWRSVTRSSKAPLQRWRGSISWGNQGRSC